MNWQEFLFANVPLLFLAIAFLLLLLIIKPRRKLIARRWKVIAALIVIIPVVTSSLWGFAAYDSAIRENQLTFGTGSGWTSFGNGDYAQVDMHLVSFNPARRQLKAVVQMRVSDALKGALEPDGRAEIEIWRKGLTESTDNGKEPVTYWSRIATIDLSASTANYEKELKFSLNGIVAFFPFDSYRTQILFTLKPPANLTKEAQILPSTITLERWDATTQRLSHSSHNVTLPLRFHFRTEIAEYQLHTDRVTGVDNAGMILLNSRWFSKAFFVVLFGTVILTLAILLLRVIVFRTQPYESAGVVLAILFGLPVLSQFVGSPPETANLLQYATIFAMLLALGALALDVLGSNSTDHSNGK